VIVDQLLKLQKQFNSIRSQLKKGCAKEEEECLKEEILKIAIEINKIEENQKFNK
jgi:hypothetical protein